jgi:L-ribulose-5-phosphate 3-epimerase
MTEVGFMQGRLSPLLHRRIQCFPTQYWEQEMYLASRNAFFQMEWTVDTLTLEANPILTYEGSKRVARNCDLFGMQISSVTCDFFMENPPWKENCLSYTKTLDSLKRISSAAEILGDLIMVIPIVDNAALPSVKEFEMVIEMLEKSQVSEYPVSFAFESDLKPKILGELISHLPLSKYGINLDTGNSAALGFDPYEEIEVLGNRILNVHLKDRKFQGASVRFGTGAVDFYAYLEGLKRIRYSKNLILQSFRSPNEWHLEELLFSRAYVNSCQKENVSL